MYTVPGFGTALATPPDLAVDPLVAAVTEIAVRVLRPCVEETAEAGVPRSHLDALAAGGAYGLIAYEPDPASGVTAERESGGWRLSGRVPWMTVWGLADVVYLGALGAAVGDAGYAHGGRRGPGRLRAGRRGGGPGAAGRLAAGVRPGERRCPARRLRAVARHRGLPARLRGYEDLGLRIADRAARLRAEAYALRDELPPGQRPADRLRLRAESLDLAVRAAAACVAVAGGRAIQYGNTAGRLSREAQFHLIQAQTGGLKREVARLMLDGP
ncbi:hypothetical protein OS965_18390 [Streptomyces sp. H27-G5]|uniref:hypothetical protein n=1 Tax=Streptomyces sp. H27-G5 TaxID=2996698 RepID=UPI00226F053B|nr:hypothetical protein [Streptomyces sp. H27-G5]MCY0920119.1 hypothetical protein [Streptomyces sp. H27-G5]